MACMATTDKLIPSLTPGTSVKIIGLGGVGSIVARYLSIFLASLNQDHRLVLIDGDHFESGNATRMIFGSQGNKAEVVMEELLPRFEYSRLSIVAIPQYVTKENLPQLVHKNDIVFLCVDNHATRKLADEYCCCQKPEGVVLISGGNDGVTEDRKGTFGNVQLYHEDSETPTLTHYHPEIANPKDKHPNDVSCTEALVSTPQILFANLAVASAMLNTFFLHVCGASHYSELAFDIAAGKMRPTIPLKGLK